MARSWMKSPMARWSSGLIAGVVMIAAITSILMLLDPHLPPLSSLMLYLLAVLPVALVWGSALAVITSVLSVAVYVYMFVPPLHSFEVSDTRATIALALFLVTALFVGELAARSRRAVLASARLTEEQAALRRVATLVARSAPPAAVFTAVTEEIGLLCGADLARMERYEPDGTVTGVAGWTRVAARVAVGRRFDLDGPSVARDVRQAGGPVRIDTFVGATGDIAREAHTLGIRSSVGCPVIVGGRLWGVVAASKKSDDPFPADTESQIAHFTELVATAVENAEARAELNASRARIVATADQTRRRIERDLHDGVQQQLVSLALRLRAAQAAVPPDREQLAAELDDITAGLGNALDELREMARGIHPAILAEGGLAPALKALARRSTIPVDLEMSIERELPERVEVSAYYVVSEALANVAKHAHASAVTVTAETSDEVLHVLIRDNGTGGADSSRGTGLVGLKDRVHALGGRIFLDSPRQAGTTLRMELPLAGEEAVTS